MRSLGVAVCENALEGGAADIAASDIVVLGVRTDPPLFKSSSVHRCPPVLWALHVPRRVPWPEHR